jgi:hypothetical protein
MQFFTTALLILATTAIAASPDPSTVSIDSISYLGSACPEGTVRKSLAADRQSFMLYFSHFNVRSGINTPISESQTKCELNINLKHPTEFSYSVAQFTYRGYAMLPAGVAAEHNSTYYFWDSKARAISVTHWDGPMNRDYYTNTTLEPATMTWSPCGVVRPLSVISRARLLNFTDKQALFIVHDASGELEHKFGLQWMTC